MAEINPLIFELIARNKKFEADMRSTTRRVADDLNRQEARFRMHSDRISSTLKGLAGTLAAAFTGREIVGLLDSFTRLQNNLKVAGLEGDALANVQERLFATAQKYGVELESLSGVYLKASLAQNELGASTEQILQLNEITAAALKITGSSAAEAQGALLQLGQALGSGVVRAEEFNSILEGALPLAQAAARGIEGMGGSVAKLRAEIADGNVSSQEFFQGVLKGGVQTLQDAEKATLTLSGGFTTLSNALTVYFGEADKANGVSAAMGTALEGIAENLDVLIPALAVVATALGVGYVTNAIAARIATVALGTAAANTGKALLAAFGGPVGIAITAITVSLGYLTTAAETAEDAATRLRAETDQLRQSNADLRGRLEAAGVAVDGLGSAADGASSKVSGLNKQMAVSVGLALNMARAFQKVALLEGDLSDLRATRKRLENPNLLDGPGALGRLVRNQFGGNDALIRELRQKEIALEESIALQVAAFKNGVSVDPPAIPTAGAATGTGKPAKKARGGGLTGPSAAEIALRQLDELARLRQEEIQAQIAITTNANERAALQREFDAIEYESRRRAVETDADLDEQQKAEQIAILDSLYGYQEATEDGRRIVVRANASLYARAIEQERLAQIEREEADLAAERYQAEQESLRLQYDLADTQDQRRAIALAILDAEDEYLRSKLEAVIASKIATEAEKERAQIALDAVNATAPARREAVSRAEAGALDRYVQSLSDPKERVEAAVVRQLERVNDGITDAISKAIGVEDPFIKDLLNILLEEVLLKPLAEALSNASSGGSGGGLLSGLASIGAAIFGGARATGGPVSAGKAYLVGERGPEIVVPNAASTVIPNSAIRAANSPLSGSRSAKNVSTIRVELSGDLDARMVKIGADTSVQVYKALEPGTVQKSVGEAFRVANRPRM